MASTPQTISIVDMGALGVGKEKEGGSPAEWRRVAQELYDALSSVGFVYLSNHGIPDAQMTDIVKACDAFFKLDEETKARYNTSAESVSHGYMKVGREKLDHTSEFFELRESYYMKNLGGLFPDSEVPQLRPTATAFIASCTTLGYQLLTALALGLGLERDFFVAAHQGMGTDSPPNSTTLRINHYPPLPDNVPENVIRCAEHTDFGCITLLFQDSMGGLQVRNVDGEWVDAPPIPGTILINSGDLLQIWTANRLMATKHRVVIPEEEARKKASRFSAAFFIHPDHEVLVQPVDGSTSPPSITARNHLLNMYAKTRNY